MIEHNVLVCKEHYVPDLGRPATLMSSSRSEFRSLLTSDPRCDIERFQTEWNASEAIGYWSADGPIRSTGCQDPKRLHVERLQLEKKVQAMIQPDLSDTAFDVRLARINRRYPRIDLRPTRFASYWKEKVPTISWEPDLDVCVDFFLRFHKLINENPDEASSVLLTFIRDHQIASDWSGWVIFAAGWICLGFPEGFRPDGKPRATKFFKSYWTAVCSPKTRKAVARFFASFQANKELDRFKVGSPHRTHFRQAVKFLQRHSGKKQETIFGLYKQLYPACNCLSVKDFKHIDTAISKVSPWFNAVARPPISHLLAEFAALKHGMAGGRAVTEFRSKSTASSLRSKTGA